MGRTKAPRKRYTPRGARADAHLHAIDRIATLLDTQRAQLLNPLHDALESFRTGHGSARTWCDLADATNVGEVLAELRIGANLRPMFLAAQQALSAVHQRQQDGRGWTLRGQELTALDDAAWAARVQLEHCTQGELQQAIDTVKRRAAGALAGNVTPDTIVCVGLLGRAAPQEAAA